MENLRNLENPTISEENKAKIVNEISETFDSIIVADGNQAVIECYLNVFLNYLKNTPCQFSQDGAGQKVFRH